MRRFIWSVLLALSIAPAFGATADAGAKFCEDDPIIIVEGREARVTTAFLQSYLETLTGPVRIEVIVPSNVTARIVELPSIVPSTVVLARSDDRWDGRGDIEVDVKITVNATARFDTVTTVTGPAVRSPFTVDGRSNHTTKIELHFAR